MSAMLEWRLAARWAGYTWEAFTALEGDEQAMIVATYRCSTQIDAVVAYAMWKKQQKAAKK